jgi:FdhD protein
MPSDELAPSSIAKVRVQKTDSSAPTSDSVVVEEPLEIRIKCGDKEEQLGITMRTPGNDLELAVSVKVCADKTLSLRQRANVVIAEVLQSSQESTRILERRFTITSACGVCGSTNISDLHKRGIIKVSPSAHSIQELAQMASLLDGRQRIFEKTGGLHAALLVDPEGQVSWVREDVGRHNAVDKVIGAALIDGKIPLAQWTLVVSGRIGYELVQKSICAGISAIVGVSAPTSLAVDLAAEFGLTLLAFARDGIAKHYLPTDL